MKRKQFPSSMYSLKCCVNKRSVLIALCLVTLCVLTYILFILSQYEIDRHKWFFSHGILDLPARDVEYFNTRRHDYDGWTPGNTKWLVDLTELHTKLPKNVSARDHHEILYYDKRPFQRLAMENSLLEVCPYKNCHITDDRQKYSVSSAVIFEISHHSMGLPPPNRPANQIWVFNDFEPPLINERWDHRHRTWNGKLNWSMTFRYDSDIIRNFGYLRTRTPEQLPKVDYHEVFTRKKKFAAWFVSNCGSMTMSARNEYVNELRKYIPIDVYGNCGTMVAKRTAEVVKGILSDYKFFLSFENSFCTDYVTEKFFQYFEISDAVLVVRGGADYDQLLPEYTHINAQHFSNARDLGLYLLSLNKSEEEYTTYLRTRDKYEVLQMNWACNLCIKLNKKQSFTKVYSDLVGWWHRDKCWAATDVIIMWTAKRKWMAAFLFLACLVSITFIYIRKPFDKASDFSISSLFNRKMW